MEEKSNWEKTGEKLKSDVQAKKDVDEKNKEIAKSHLDLVKQNDELQQLMKDSVDVGSEEVIGQLPYLKIHQAGRSASNLLEDGSEPKNGAIFLTSTREEFNSVDMRVLAVSKGFKVPSKDPKTGAVTMRHNHLMVGSIIDHGPEKPFYMYLNGKKLSSLYDLLKEIGDYKKMNIPMFQLTIQMTTERQENDQGYSYVPVFTILKDSSGMPILITDTEEFVVYRDRALKAKESLAQLIEQRHEQGNNQIEDDIPVPLSESDVYASSDMEF